MERGTVDQPHITVIAKTPSALGYLVYTRRREALDPDRDPSSQEPARMSSFLHVSN